MAVMILKYPDLNTEEVAIVLEWVFYVLLPNFCFGNSMNDLFNNHQGLTVCRDIFDEIGVDRDFLCDMSRTLNLTNPCCTNDPGRRFFTKIVEIGNSGFGPFWMNIYIIF